MTFDEAAILEMLQSEPHEPAETHAVLGGDYLRVRLRHGEVSVRRFQDGGLGAAGSFRMRPEDAVRFALALIRAAGGA